MIEPTKRCPRCGVEKVRSEFSKRSGSALLRSWCRVCESDSCSARYRAANRGALPKRSAAYRAEDPEKAKARRAEKARLAGAAYRAANREKLAARSAAWNAANPEKASARKAAWRKANPEKALASTAAWYAANPEKAAASAAAWVAANPEYMRVYGLMRSLKKFGLSQEDYEAKLVEQGNRCPVCDDVYTVGGASRPCVEHSHTREARLGARASLRGIVCHTCNRNRIGGADRYLRKLGILDTDPEAFPALLKRKVSFAEQVAKHVVATWGLKDALNV